jgi:hypothetical protein
VRRANVRVYRVVLVAVMLVIVLSAGSAGATTQTKFYGASVTPSFANSTVTYTLTLKNDSSSTQTLGSANFWAPAGWVLTTPTAVQSADGHSWSASTQSGSTAPDGSKNLNVVQLRANTNNDALAPGQQISTTVGVTCTAAGTWQTEAKQANNFSGSSGNDFLPVSGNSNIATGCDQATTCYPTTIKCELTNGTTTIDADTPTTGKLSLGLLSGSGVSFTGCPTTGALSGGAVAFVDPTNYPPGPFTITLTYDKSIAPGTGVSNFVVCKSNDGGLTWKQLSPCKNQPSPPCISSRNRTGAGDLVENLLVTPTDPAYGTD